jgi:hypothetical protein
LPSHTWILPRAIGVLLGVLLGSVELRDTPAGGLFLLEDRDSFVESLPLASNEVLGVDFLLMRIFLVVNNSSMYDWFVTELT